MLSIDHVLSPEPVGVAFGSPGLVAPTSAQVGTCDFAMSASTYTRNAPITLAKSMTGDPYWDSFTTRETLMVDSNLMALNAEISVLDPLRIKPVIAVWVDVISF